MTGSAPAAGPLGRSYWVEEGALLAGAYPGDVREPAARAKLRGILAAGVRTFSSLMQAQEVDHAGRVFAPYESLVHAEARSLGITQDVRCLRFPIIDMSVPRPEQMDQTLDQIDGSIAAGAPVYVHCWGGRGRTGTVVGCWLIRRGLATPENFVERIQGLRRHDESGGPSPENSTQLEFVRTWAASRL